MSGSVIFVYGALRSGTTVFRLMLNAHEQIHNPGEADFLFDYLKQDPSAPDGWRYDRKALADNRIFRAHDLEIPSDLDGLALMAHFIAQFQSRAPGSVLTLNIHRHAELIMAAMPDARIIHLLRDPRDVARSSVGMGWAGLSYFGIDHWIRTEESWEAANVPAAQVLALKFEDLMADLEGSLLKVCDFLAVPFSPKMFDYHHNTTYDPPDPNLAEQWRKKAAPHEIALLEGKCGQLIASRGYAAGAQRHIPGRIELAILTSRNTIGRWRASIRRFGLPLLVSAKVTGWIGATERHRRLRRQMDAKTAEKLK